MVIKCRILAFETLWKSFGVTIKWQTKVASRSAHACPDQTRQSSVQPTILMAHSAHPLPFWAKKYECSATRRAWKQQCIKNIYVGISGKCHTMLPRFTTAAHLLFDEFMAKRGLRASLLLVPGGTAWRLLTASLSMTNWWRIRFEHAK